jgi:hypothetical protein
MWTSGGMSSRFHNDYRAVTVGPQTHETRRIFPLGHSMSGWLVIAVGVVYAAVAVDQVLKGNLPMGIVFAGYAGSNVGLWLALK